MKSKEIPTLLFCRREIITERTATDERANGVDRSRQSQKAINRLLLSDNLYRKQKIPVCLCIPSLSSLIFVASPKSSRRGLPAVLCNCRPLPLPLLSPFRALFNPDLKIINQTIDQVLTMAWEAGGERERSAAAATNAR